ncbi:methyltransferase domain-containing protein [Microbispora bryophytorum]|uniref:Methyltransferase n=1 Tax=Microbispora bryophytorum TaxID=1460882 RepID=A0A8H9LF54_9ACTN|nr:methyltransferase domain-containing protein [Microbispora bryophytorum]MBD3137654.1 methyltransferase domain-containing protein [Microbispora bryophytorum]TQS05938.1 methyltransferase domain-containing protein [Microbispora bryophytorum]GGO20221.1 methyltransferase [Microbispora bryophytorum]
MSNQSLIALLDRVDRHPGQAALRARSYELLGLAAGSRVVDVGCGAGLAVAEMAALGARPIGLDVDGQVIEVARSRHPGLEFRRSDACDLPFGDGELAGYRADKVYHALADPARAAAEAWRVLAPGGRIVLMGQDWDTFVIDSDDPALTRVMVRARADAVPSPHAARRHRTLLLDAGFADVTAEVRTGVFTDGSLLPMVTGVAEGAYAAGAVTRCQADDWIAEQTGRARRDRLFLAVPMFLAAARRP